MSCSNVIHILCLLPIFLSLSSTDLNIFSSFQGGASYSGLSLTSSSSLSTSRSSFFGCQAKTLTVETDSDSGHFGFQTNSGEDLALIKAHTGEDRLEFASKLRVGSLTVNSLDDFSIEEESADGGPPADLLSMAEQVEELATEVFGIQTALKRIGRKHLHFWLNAADAQFTTNGEGEQSLETWEPRLPSRFEQLGKQLLNFTPVTNSAFAAPGQGSEAFKGIKPVHFGGDAALSSQYDDTASAVEDYAESIYPGDLTIIAVTKVANDNQAAPVLFSLQDATRASSDPLSCSLGNMESNEYFGSVPSSTSVMPIIPEKLIWGHGILMQTQGGRVKISEWNANTDSFGTSPIEVMAQTWSEVDHVLTSKLGDPDAGNTHMIVAGKAFAAASKFQIRIYKRPSGASSFVQAYSLAEIGISSGTLSIVSTSLAVFDVDGDGTGDLVFAAINSQSGYFGYYTTENDGALINSDPVSAQHTSRCLGLFSVDFAVSGGSSDPRLICLTSESIVDVTPGPHTDGSPMFGNTELRSLADMTGTSPYPGIPQDLQFADFNQDGLVDILLLMSKGGITLLYQAESSGGFATFAETQTILVASQVSSSDPQRKVSAMWPVDVDGEGRQDIVVSIGSKTTGGQQDIMWFRNTQAAGMLQASFASTFIYQCSNCKWMYAVPADVNGDGSMDIIVSAQTATSPGDLYTFLNQVGCKTVDSLAAVCDDTQGLVIDENTFMMRSTATQPAFTCANNIPGSLGMVVWRYHKGFTQGSVGTKEFQSTNNDDEFLDMTGAHVVERLTRSGTIYVGARNQFSKTASAAEDVSAAFDLMDLVVINRHLEDFELRVLAEGWENMYDTEVRLKR